MPGGTECWRQSFPQEVIGLSASRLFSQAVVRELEKVLGIHIHYYDSQHPSNATMYSSVSKEMVATDENGQLLQSNVECILAKPINYTYCANTKKVYFNCALGMLHVSALSQVILRHVNTKSSKGRYSEIKCTGSPYLQSPFAYTLKHKI
jgi:hypothetical protein